MLYSMPSACGNQIIKLILIISLNLMVSSASSDSNQTGNETISLFNSSNISLITVNPGDSIQDAIEESEPGSIIEESIVRMSIFRSVFQFVALMMAMGCQ